MPIKENEMNDIIAITTMNYMIVNSNIWVVHGENIRNKVYNTNIRPSFNTLTSKMGLRKDKTIKPSKWRYQKDCMIQQPHLRKCHSIYIVARFSVCEASNTRVTTSRDSY